MNIIIKKQAKIFMYQNLVIIYIIIENQIIKIFLFFQINHKTLEGILYMIKILLIFNYQ